MESHLSRESITLESSEMASAESLTKQSIIENHEQFFALVLAPLTFAALAILYLLLNIHWFGTEISADSYYDLNTYYRYIRLIRDDQLPYIDFKIEYPVFFGLVLVVLSAIPFQSFVEFSYLYWGFCYSIYCFTVLVLYNTGTLLGVERLVEKLFLFVVFSPTYISLLLIRYDILPLLAVATAFNFFVRYQNSGLERHLLLSLLFCSIGLNIKWFPIFLLPFVFVVDFNRRKVISRLVFAILPSILLNGPFMVLGLETWVQSYLVHFNRIPNTDSFYFPVSLVTGSVFQTLTTLLFILFVLLSGLLVIVSYKRQFSKPRELLWAYIVVTVLFLLLNKVFSPQFLLWVFPLLIFLPWQRFFLLIPLIDVINIFTILFLTNYQVLFPLTILRHVLLFLFLVLLVRSFKNNLKEVQFPDNNSLRQ